MFSQLSWGGVLAGVLGGVLGWCPWMVSWGHSGPADPKNLNLNRTFSGRRTFSGCSGWSIGSVRTCTHVEPLRTLLNLAGPF